MRAADDTIHFTWVIFKNFITSVKRNQITVILMRISDTIKVIRILFPL